MTSLGRHNRYSVISFYLLRLTYQSRFSDKVRCDNAVMVVSCHQAWTGSTDHTLMTRSQLDSRDLVRVAKIGQWLRQDTGDINLRGPIRHVQRYRRSDVVQEIPRVPWCTHGMAHKTAATTPASGGQQMRAKRTLTVSNGNNIMQVVWISMRTCVVLGESRLCFFPSVVSEL